MIDAKKFIKFLKNNKISFFCGVPDSILKEFSNEIIKTKGIKGRDKKTGKFISDKSLKFLIARSIKNKGIRASMFFTKPFEAGIKKYENDIAIGYGDDILRQL